MLGFFKKDWLTKHPGANPNRKDGRAMQHYFVDRKKGVVTLVSQSRWMPHQSTRQRARYARQIAAGQLQMEGVNNG